MSPGMPGMMGAGMAGAESAMGGGEGYAGADPAGLSSAGYPGTGAAGSFPGAEGALGVPGAQVPGGKGPVFKEAEKKEVKFIDRTDFVVQFIWTPTVERDRKDADPRVPVSAGADGAAAPADGEAAPADGAAAAGAPAP